MKETDLVKTIQLRATERGARLFRNNVGFATTSTGQKIHFGLFVGSGDLIGWTPVIITPEMIGKTLAVFTSIECKLPKGVVKPQQHTWDEIVRNAGGISAIVRSEADYFGAVNG